jgi:hypothetical protein
MVVTGALGSQSQNDAGGAPVTPSDRGKALAGESWRPDGRGHRRFRSIPTGSPRAPAPTGLPATPSPWTRSSARRSVRVTGQRSHRGCQRQLQGFNGFRLGLTYVGLGSWLEEVDTTGAGPHSVRGLLLDSSVALTVPANRPYARLAGVARGQFQPAYGRCALESRNVKTLRVIQWATGGVGKAAIEAVLNHPELELAGCWVHSPDKNGRDVGEIAGREPLGVVASSSTDDVLAVDADCVVYSPLVPHDDEVKAILRSGKNVVTPVGWVYPDRTDRRVRDIEQACLDGGVSLHGSGIHPGGITEKFPLMISALSTAITHVRAEEFSDIRTYNAPDVVHHIMGFGGIPEEAARSPMAGLLEGGFKSSVRMVADYLGFRDPTFASTQEVAIATAPIDAGFLTIEPGTVAARRFRWQALVDGQPVITAAVNWLMGEDDLDPAWNFGERGERFEVQVSGDPDVEVIFKGLQPDSIAEGLRRNPGVVATANHCVHAIPYVCAAGPGIKTYLDLPMIAGRPAPKLAGAVR